METKNWYLQFDYFTSDKSLRHMKGLYVFLLKILTRVHLNLLLARLHWPISV